jgi:hypothetical protein
MCAVNCDFDPRFVKPGIDKAVRAVAMSATRPVSSSASNARHMPDSRAVRLHADRSGKFSFAQEGSLIPAALGNDRCPVACGKMASRNIQRADFHGAWKDPIAPSNQATQTKRVFPDRH